MKKRYYWLIGILLVLIITNPTINDFKAYKGTQATESENKDIYNLSRKANFFIFSIYDDGFTRSYLGIGKNFFSIGNSNTNNTKVDTNAAYHEYVRKEDSAGGAFIKRYNDSVKKANKN